jgi:hypothetical protein
MDIYEPGQFCAGIKSFVSRKQDEALFYSPRMNVTSFISQEDQMWESKGRRLSKESGTLRKCVSLSLH